MRQAVIVDLDGTIADMGKGQPEKRSPFDWHRVGEDQPIGPIIHLVSILRGAGYQIIFVSGRDEVCRNQTDMWLVANGAVVLGICDPLLMRPAGDNRPDEDVKREIYKREIEPNWRVAYVIDDRSKVVRMWRDLDLTVLQCADGDF
jgi:hypothetical protein